MLYKSHDPAITRRRIRALREGEKYSQTDLAKVLQPVLKSITDKPVALDGEGGKQTISQWELGKRGVTLDVLFAYANVFNVSIDYLTGWTDDEHPEYASAKEELHLDDESVRRLKTLLCAKHYPLDDNGAPDYSAPPVIPMAKEVNAIISSDRFSEMVLLLTKAQEYTDSDVATIDVGGKKGRIISQEVARYSLGENTIHMREMYTYQFGQAANHLFAETMDGFGKKAYSFTVDMTEEEMDAAIEAQIAQAEERGNG